VDNTCNMCTITQTDQQNKVFQDIWADTSRQCERELYGLA